MKIEATNLLVSGVFNANGVLQVLEVKLSDAKAQRSTSTLTIQITTGACWPPSGQTPA